MASQCTKVFLFMLMGSTLLLAYLNFPGSPPRIPKVTAKHTTKANGNFKNQVKTKPTRIFKHHNKTPLILLFNTWHRIGIWSEKLRSSGKASLLQLKYCRYKCDYSYNRKLYEETADLVAVSTFYFRDKKYSLTADRIKARQDKTGQIWLGTTYEAPLRHWKAGKSLDGVFNWIATYRRDADVYWPYGRFIKRKHSTKSKASVTQKTKKLASWLVSNCKTNSMRRLLVRNLQRFIPIDVYGRCQKLKCPRNQDCRAFLGQTYKFYMAFENSLCLDYITEKVFNAYENNLVPVIYAWLNDSTLLPPGSYINALDFNTAKDLAIYLRHLDTHEDEYLKFFEWKRHYRLEEFDNGYMLCEACGKLNWHLGHRTGRLKRHSSMLGWLSSWHTNRSSGLKFKFGQNTLSTGDKLCVNASKSPDVLAWLTR